MKNVLVERKLGMLARPIQEESNDANEDTMLPHHTHSAQPTYRRRTTTDFG